MKKAIFTFLVSGLLGITVLKAQTVQDGINHLYAERYKNAINVFQQLLAVNPNNIEATYWLGQAYLDNDEIESARIAAAKQLYQKALAASANAPLLIVGMGHIALLENKPDEARQQFEAALTLTRTKKGDDPTIQTAIGRANVDAKSGDFNYAIVQLTAATAKDPKNTETLLQLGNAYRKAKPGEGGGDAYQTYNKALQVNAAFAIASLRLAKLFESQKNWDLVLQYLNESVTRDSKFTAGYYELFYYYFFRQKYPEAENQLKKYIDSKLPETDIQDQYLYAQLCWAQKNFGCATSKSESVVAALGDHTKPKVYRLLADSYLQFGDSVNAMKDSVKAASYYALGKKYSDLFFAKKNPDDIILPDYETRALILAKMGGTPDDVYNTYVQGVSLDTTLDAKLGFLKKGVLYFRENKQRDKEALMLEKLISMKPKPIINDYFDLTLAYYFALNYSKSRDEALTMVSQYPDQVYGYEWAYNNSVIVDTVKKDSIAFPDAQKLYNFSLQDSVKYKSQYLKAVKFMAAYYINVAKDKDKALEYFNKWLQSDPANAVMIQGYIDQIKKMGTRPATNSPRGNAPPVPPGKTSSGALKR